MTSPLAGVFDALLDLFYPPTCAACGASLLNDRGELMIPKGASAPLCPACRKEVAASAEVLCPKCAGSRFYVRGEKDCRSCRNKKFRFDRVTALGPYQGALRRAVLRMKTARNDLDAVAFARFLVETRREELLASAPDLVLCVPSHPLRRLSHGVNSAYDLAAEIARKLNLPFAPRTLVRVRWTERQAALRKEDRIANVAGAFAVRPTRLWGDVMGDMSRGSSTTNGRNGAGSDNAGTPGAVFRDSLTTNGRNGAGSDNAGTPGAVFRGSSTTNGRNGAGSDTTGTPGAVFRGSSTTNGRNGAGSDTTGTPGAAPRGRGRRILLVDDILTTGATANEITRVLRAAGAASVAVAVLSRAEGG